ncbi:MAG: hypothetical protein ACO1RT_00785 [Planctomycetaceae bacterium]
MIDPKLLELIRCPVDGQPLMQANEDAVQALNACIGRGEIRDASDGLVDHPIDGALVTQDGARAHAVRGGIPTLIPGESMTLPPSVRALLQPLDQAASSR